MWAARPDGKCICCLVRSTEDAISGSDARKRIRDEMNPFYSARVNPFYSARAKFFFSTIVQQGTVTGNLMTFHFLGKFMPCPK